LNRNPQIRRLQPAAQSRRQNTIDCEASYKYELNNHTNICTKEFSTQSRALTTGDNLTISCEWEDILASLSRTRGLLIKWIKYQIWILIFY